MYMYMYLYCAYIGKDETLLTEGRGQAHAVVLALLQGLEAKGHHVYTDNYYFSPALFSELMERACSTVKINLPKSEINAVTLKSSLVSLRWTDKRQVTMLSTVHDDEMM